MGEVGHVEFSRRLHEVVEPFQPAPHVGKLRLDSLQPFALLTGHAVHLLVHDLDQIPNVALGQDVGANRDDGEVIATESSTGMARVTSMLLSRSTMTRSTTN